MARPAVSFIVIAFNEQRAIARCLASIEAQQSLANYEIVVVDDGSADNTAAIVAERAVHNPAIILHRLPTNQGRGAARAAGVKLARGTHLAFIDADIILPPEWLATCLPLMADFDAVSGVAVPDGDVSFIYALFDLKPKKTAHSTAVTGSNGLYKRAVFDAITFDPALANGEDVAFNHAMSGSGFKTKAVNSLVVAHKEHKTFGESMRWLYQSGLGAARQLKVYKEVRLPDLAYFGFLATLLGAIAASFVWQHAGFFALPALALMATSLLHVYTKFVLQLQTALPFTAAVLVNSLLLLAYYAGRSVGTVTPLKEKTHEPA